jgi:two-component system chemotaxis sensor kinase CheA
LDVVREAASRLGGEVTVRTEARSGTSIEILVPVSLSSLDALLVEAGNQAAAIPLESVRRTLRLSPTDVARTAEGESIVFEGKVIPFAPLARALRAGAATLSTPRARSAVVVEGRGAMAALGVDRMLGTERLVLRPLPEWTPADPVLAGTSLDAEGNPQIVLDPDALVAEASRSEAATQATPTLRPPILVIDDSLTTRMLEQSILESAGYEVDLATSAEEALEKARRRRYALFLVDVEMPGMDGFAFVERTRIDRTLRGVPAILVTSRASPEDRRRGEEVGARAYIVKSEFDQADLLERIRKLVG